MPTEPNELARQIRRMNQNNICILQLIIDGYEIKIGPGIGLDWEEDKFTFSVAVTRDDETITQAEGHCLNDLINDVYTNTPEI